MNGTREDCKIDTVRFRDKEGNPTCAFNFYSANCYCEFYRTQKFGTDETCLFAPPGYKNTYMGESLERRKNENGDHLGTLIPGKWCPLWK